MKIAKRTLAGAMLLGALVAPAARGQGVTYSTTGEFTSTFPGVCSMLVCSGGGFTLTYIPVALSANNTPNVGGTVPLGNFTLEATSPTTGPVTAPPGAVTFRLDIIQTSPSGATGSTIGGVTGTVQASPTSFSTLIWTPTPQNVLVDGVTYSLIFDQGTNGIRIALNGNGNTNPTAVKASITAPTAVPEPASMALLATGLMGMFGGAIRNRRKGASESKS